MIAQHDRRRTSEVLDETQNTYGVRAPIDQIADKPEAIVIGMKVDAIDQPVQLRRTALHVTDCVGCHS